MVKLGIMIEGQEGLNWERWFRLVDAAEDLGFDSIWRSDHLFSSMGDTDRETLALVPSLAAAAMRTQRVEFGTLVSPTTFRHPVHLAMEGVSLDLLSNGRYWHGLGAGWNESEHEAFGFPLPPLKERMDRFEEALKVTKLLWSGETVSFDGQYFPLRDARNSLTSSREGGPRMIIGGKGEKRTLPLVAEYADEWNATTITRDAYERLSDVLQQQCEKIGRDFHSIQRSLMTAHIVGRDQDDLLERARRQQEIWSVPAEELISRGRERGWMVGTVDEVIEVIRARGQQGIDRIMLQTLDMDDMDAVRLIAEEIMPNV